MTALSSFTSAYITAALWSSTDDNGEPLDARFDAGDLSPELRNQIESDCAAFLEANREAIDCEGAPHGPDGSDNFEMAGHDFWLTRCGHGAGFWDGDWPEPYADQLDKAASAFGGVDLYIGDDGKIYA